MEWVIPGGRGLGTANAGRMAAIAGQNEAVRFAGEEGFSNQTREEKNQKVGVILVHLVGLKTTFVNV